MNKYTWLILFYFTMLIQSNDAQNYFYNTSQFGLQSTLLGGTTTSGNSDLSMAYYNPAALHLAKSKADISLITPRFDNFGFDNYFGPMETEDTDFSIDFGPNLASYNIKANDKINITAITIKQSEWNRSIVSQNVEELPNGKREQFFQYAYSGRDRWVGAGFSIKLNNNVAIGFSQFFSSARYAYNYTLQSNTFESSASEPSMRFQERLQSSHANRLSLLSKLGLHLNYSHHTIGLVIKTPNYVKLLRSGTFDRELLDITTQHTGLKTFRDYELKPNIRTPWEFNLGYALSLNDGSKLWFNTAYYPGIEEYDMVSMQNVDENILNWKNGNKEVLNFGVGYSKIVKPGFEIIGSFRRNLFSQKKLTVQENAFQTLILDDDRNHLALGSKFNFFNNPVEFGLDWSFGKRPNQDVFSGFSNIERLTTTSSDYSFNSISILLTYGFIIDSVTRRVSDNLSE